jgi:hypothetical protein
MAEMDKGWTVVATFTRGFEADVAISRLESEDIPTVKRGNVESGVFGAGFEGAAPGGYSVLVPKHEVSHAMRLLAHLEADAEVDDEDSLENPDSPPNVRD